MGPPASDRILLPELKFSARVGILPGEAEQAQPLRARLELWLDLDAAARSDRIEDSFDYRRLTGIVEEAVAQGPCGLLEHLAGRMLDGCFADARVRRVRVRLAKLTPVLGEAFGPVAVELDRDRERWNSGEH